MTKKVKLSIVVTTRNDDHGVYLIQRFQTFLKHLTELCNKHKFYSELIIVEWNPEVNKEPLKKCISWPTSEYLSFRIIIVPNKIHKQFKNHEIFPLFQMIAKNVGIRRARSSWVLCTNVDILFSSELIKTLSDENLDTNAYYRIDRHDLGVFLVPNNITLKERIAFCESHVLRIHCQNGTLTPKEYPYLNKINYLTPHSNACGDFTLCSRDNWFKLLGYPEFPISSIYIDGLLLYAAKAIGLNQKIFLPPCKIYHIEHKQGWILNESEILKLPHLDYEKDYIPLCNKMLATKKPLSFNNSTWGLANIHLEEFNPVP